MTTTALDAAPFLGSGVWAQVVPLLRVCHLAFGLPPLLQAGPEEPVSKGMGWLMGLFNCSNLMQAGEPLLKGRLEVPHHTAWESPTEAEKNNSLLRQKIMLTHSQSWR